MSYEDTKCPCGGKKPTSTMLCDDCESTFAARREMQTFKGAHNSWAARRQAALILLALARGRRHLDNNGSTGQEPA